MVAEKAWAKLFGSYNALDGGFPSDTMVYLTGGWRKALKWDPGDEPDGARQDMERRRGGPQAGLS